MNHISMHTPAHCFTRFNQSIDTLSLPDRFTFPFFYKPHPLCVLACEQLQQHLLNQAEWQHNFGVADDDDISATGKMFGVLLVRDDAGDIGFLSAFSGKIAGGNLLPHFVPPVFDMLAKDCFFPDEQGAINHISRQAKTLQGNKLIDELTDLLVQSQAQYTIEVTAQQSQMSMTRKQRKDQRLLASQSLSTEQQQQLLLRLSKESISEKNSLRDLKMHWTQKILSVSKQLNTLTEEIDLLLARRKSMSNTLQHKLFSQYQFLNNAGQTKDLNQIFKDTAFTVPPAGAGECAAPKLLHYAFKHGFEVLAMAEFWWGMAPKSQVRQHKNYYPACIGKCQPILAHMLAGIELDENPLLNNPARGKQLDIIYQD
ncbi:MAG: RNA pseudouridine synthase, partial [Psychrobium sp.]|nr:RNA pseudouridine synthase [Psychrobium sp.]